MRRSFLVPFLAASLLLVLVAGPAAARSDAAPRGKAPTIAGTAVAAGSFSTLVAAVSCTGLLGAIDDPSDPQLTVFAPTDAAFATLGLDEDNICSTFSTEELTGILADHIVPGRYPAGRVLQAGTLSSLGGPLDVAADLAPVLVTTDIQTANGVIHVIDEVLLLDN
jgi:transforming growth factor-beta-induced protein